jgi:HNH endonuclease
LAFDVLFFLDILNVKKESKQEQLERIKLAWSHFKKNVVGEVRSFPVVCSKVEVKNKKNPQNNPQSALARGSKKNNLHGNLLRGFWKYFESNTDEDKLGRLIILANQPNKLRIKPRKLRRVRKKYERHRRSLLNIPDCKCGTCDRPARIRHHIIPLCFGGRNSPLNLILICNQCHEKIHPWMARK